MLKYVICSKWIISVYRMNIVCMPEKEELPLVWKPQELSNSLWALATVSKGSSELPRWLAELAAEKAAEMQRASEKLKTLNISLKSF